MTAEDTRYNGWTNYETWCVNLWLSNDEGLYNLVRDRVHEEIAELEDGETDEAISSFAAWLSDELCSPGGEYGLVPELDGFAADLLGAALSEVDWDEIASSWIEEL